MKKALEYLALTPAIVQLVFTLVGLFETEGNGEAKKQAVLDTVEQTYAELTATFNLTVDKAFVLKIASLTIDIAVSFHNLVGTFKKQAA